MPGKGGFRHDDDAGGPGGPRRAPRDPKAGALDRADGERVCDELRKALEGFGFGVIFARAFPNRHLQVMIEGPEGATVTVGDCERGSRVVEAAIQAAGHDPGTFEIEVESPGADRPLTRPADFERFRGQRVQVTLKEPRDVRRNFTGALVGRTAAGDVTIHVLDEPEPETFPAAEIKEVRLHPDPKELLPPRRERGPGS